MAVSTPLARRLVRKMVEQVVPWEITLELTKYCNFDCVHCYVPRDGLGLRREMSLDEVKRLLDEFHALGGMMVHLTGGEVMVHRHFLEVVRHIRGHHMGLHISSNGSRVDERTADEMARLGVGYLGISLYGATPETDEKVTRRRGSHEATMRGLDHLLSRGIQVRIKLPVMKANLHDIGERVAIARRLGLPFSIDHSITPKNNGDRSTEAERISLDEMKALHERIVTEFKPYMAPNRAQVPPSFTAEPEPPRERAAFCNVGLTFCAIDSFGDVFPCIAFPAVAGNVREQSFTDIWRHAPLFEKLRHAKLEDVKGCNTCDVAQTCSRCIGHAYLVDGDMMGPSSLDCIKAGKEAPTYFGAGKC